MADCLTTWLQNLNLSEYQSSFTDNGYNTCDQCLRIISKEELKRIGVTKVGHVNRLFRAIEKLRSDAELSQTVSGSGDGTATLVQTDLPKDPVEPTEPTTTCSSSLPLSSSTASTSVSKNPPPVPLRRSIRRTNQSSSLTPSPVPPESVPESVTPSHHSHPYLQSSMGAEVKTLPPPVLPRQQSLKCMKEGEQRNVSDSPLTLAKAGNPQLSPIPQSPMLEPVEHKQEFPPTLGHNGAPVMENNVQICEATLPLTRDTEAPPKISPKLRRKHESSSIPSKRMSTPFVPLNTFAERGQHLNGHLVEQNASTEGGEREVSPVVDVPALPPKRSAKRIVIPDEDVEFELENVPMPPARDRSNVGTVAGGDGLPTLLSKNPGPPDFNPLPPSAEFGVENGTVSVPVIHNTADLNVPPLPPKDSRPPNFAPQLPTRESSLEKGPSVLEAPMTPPLPPRDAGPPDFAPPPPPKQISPEPRSTVPRGPPPPLPPRVSSTLPSTRKSSDDNQVEDVPQLPPKDTGLPQFKPPPPPVESDSEDDGPPDMPYKYSPPEMLDHIRSPPPLPPKEIPPPPPPITDEDFPDSEEGFIVSEMDDEDEEEGALLMSIQSKTNSVVVNDDILLIAPSSENIAEDFSSLDGISSHEPAPNGSIVWQQTDADLFSKNYTFEGQEVVVDAVLDNNKDYANQDAIDESIKIKGTAPIKVRSLQRDTDKDYENQDVLDEDVIPFGTLPSLAEQLPNAPVSMTFDRQEEAGHNTLVPPSRPRLFGGYEDVDRDYENTRDDVTKSDTEIPPLPSKTRTLGFVEASHNAPLQAKSTTLVPSTVLERPTPKPRSRTAASVVLTLAEEDFTPRTTLPVSESSDAVYNSLIDTMPVPTQPVLAPFGSSAPKPSSGDYFDGQAPLQRSVGSFAGVGCSRPLVYQKGLSLDNLSISESISPLYSRGSTSIHDVPKTKEGYLHKKGGRKSERPWAKRWVTFNGSELKYFKIKGNKESEALNTVKLGEMIDIKQVSDPDKQHRFDLVVINRVFQFYSESENDSQDWVKVLHAAISRFRPQDHETKDGGNMHSPDKQGVLLKQGHGISRGFKERYVALKGPKFAYYESKDDFVNGRPIHVLEMTLASVRPDISGKYRFSITMNNQRSYVFQASSESDRQAWMDKLTTAILTGLESRQETMSTGKPQRTKSSDILARIQMNPANKVCADCSATDPSWGVINRGMMVCINCSGVHRSMGTHISKVRSIELDQHIWTDSLIQLMVTIGNDNANSFWEHHYHGKRLPADVEREIREEFIRAKYQVKSWIATPSVEGKEALSHLLCSSVKTSNLMRTMELLVHGADPCYVLPDVKPPDANCALEIAKAHNQDFQVELLEHNGALICAMDTGLATMSFSSKKGHLYKTGSERTGWRRRYCTVDTYQGLKYFKSETDSELLGDIKPEEMFSVARCEDDFSKSQDPRHCHCFELNTQSRGYLFSADTEEDMMDWIKTIQEIISSDTAEKLGYDKVGYLKKRDPHNVGGWKRRWFTLKGKTLAYYRREREELAEVDLRKLLELKPPDQGGNLEQQCSFQIVLSERVYHLRAETPQDAESWVSALKHTQVSGIPLSDQQLTSGQIPIIVHKCLQFVETYGMEIEGLYRLSGVKAKIRKLILAFDQDARGVVIDSDTYTVHDVTGALKQFFRNLPDPLLTHDLYSEFITTCKSHHETQMIKMQQLIAKLPEVNRNTLRRIMGHLRKVIENASKNKMSLSNVVRIFGPTLMTVDGDAASFDSTQYECACIHAMIYNYKWLFQVDDDEDRKEEEIEKARKKIMEAEQEMKLHTMSSKTDFLTTVYIGNKEGDSIGTTITATTTVRDIVVKVVTQKGLPPANYALYLVLGDSESQRVLCFSECLLAALCSTGTDCFICVRPNSFAETLQQYMVQDASECVNLHVREKKRWKKCPCAIRAAHFIQFKDSKCHSESFRLSVHDFDMFAGIERNKIDVKNPMPTRYCFWLKAMRGDDNCRYLCAETEQDMLKIMAAIVKAKYPDCLQTPVLPSGLPPSDFLEPYATGVLMTASPGGSPRNSPLIARKEYSNSNLMYPGKPR